MKKLIPMILVMVLFLSGCQQRTTTSSLVMDIGGVSMVSAKDTCNLLGLTCSINNGSIVIMQDDIVLHIKDGPYVYRNGYLMYIMEKPAVYKGDTAYLPTSLISEYFKVSIKPGKDGRLSIVNRSDFSLYKIVKFFPQEVIHAINYTGYPHRDQILRAVELPRSMDIQTPKVNMDRIIVTTPLSSYSYNFKGELMKHGFTEKDLPRGSYHDYQVIERTWNLPRNIQKSVQRMYPELQSQDISGWTYGDYQDFSRQKDRADYENGFTEQQKRRLQERGIRLDDVHYLIKEFNTDIDTILTRPDKTLKKCIEANYQFSIDRLRQSN